jgi:hypothetical protein
MANNSALKDVPEHVTTTINTPALLTWLRFGMTEPPVPPSPPLHPLRRQGRLKAPPRHPFPVVKSTPAREGASHRERA